MNRASGPASANSCSISSVRDPAAPVPGVDGDVHQVPDVGVARADEVAAEPGAVGGAEADPRRLRELEHEHRQRPRRLERAPLDREHRRQVAVDERAHGRGHGRAGRRLSGLPALAARAKPPHRVFSDKWASVARGAPVARPRRARRRGVPPSGGSDPRPEAPPRPHPRVAPGIVASRHRRPRGSREAPQAARQAPPGRRRTAPRSPRAPGRTRPRRPRCGVRRGPRGAAGRRRRSRPRGPRASRRRRARARGPGRGPWRSRHPTLRPVKVPGPTPAAITPIRSQPPAASTAFPACSSSDGAVTRAAAFRTGGCARLEEELTEPSRRRPRRPRLPCRCRGWRRTRSCDAVIRVRLGSRGAASRRGNQPPPQEGNEE